ncbi:hypothetical protein [Rubrivirga marina]|uniref:Uncharacterized protein n=1 Tax=Rubrivirga marina TaxID=1196024 RepID=A0A271IXR6_9BACT|nr:hypothetical protein [Rubrivirga marina]PAP75992.1 hypothetical protein BSZ37_05815 [Rubrivirga marina]
MTPRFSLRLRALLLTALAATSLTACDSSDDEGDLGSFQAQVTGAAQASLGGQAVFAIDSEDGETTSAIALIDEDEDDVAFLLMDGRVTAKTYTIAGETAGAMLLLGETDGTGDMYFSETGTITVTRADAARVVGTFDVTAVNIADEDETVRLRGSFDAKSGTVVMPSEARVGR